MPSITRTLLSVLLIVGLAACGDGSGSDDNGFDPVDQPDALGPFAVGHRKFTAIDPARADRPIPVEIWYPVDAVDAQAEPRSRYSLAGPIGLDSDVAVDDLPVSARPNQKFLVFSHGYQGIALQSIDLMEALASHGFIVASPEHTGNAQFSADDTFDQAAANRVPDVSLLFDTMIARNRDPGDPFYERIDEERFGVIGHSFGGMTAIGTAAGWAGAEPDPRIAAIAPVSAVIDAKLQSDVREGANAGFTEQQLSRIEIPVMLVGGTEDIDVFPENNEIAFEQIVNSPRVYKVDVIGANHNHFASVCVFGELLLGLGLAQERWPDIGAAALIEPFNATCTPEVFPITEATRLLNLYSVSFFRRHLLGERGYDQFLSTSFATTEPSIRLARK